MIRSLYSGVAGIKTHQTKMDVVGNNIANVNTVGFKSNRVTFADTLYQTSSSASGAASANGGINAKQVGLGVGVATIDTIFSDASATGTGNNTDLALTGNGLFVVRGGSGVYYTRDGAFNYDEKGNYVLPGNGFFVQGWMAQDGVLNTSGAATDITIPSGKVMAAKATEAAAYLHNLDASAATITGIKVTGKDVNGATVSGMMPAGSAVSIGDRVTAYEQTSIIPHSVTLYDADGNAIATNLNTAGTYTIGDSYNGTRIARMTVTGHDASGAAVQDAPAFTSSVTLAISGNITSIDYYDANGNVLSTINAGNATVGTMTDAAYLKVTDSNGISDYVYPTTGTITSGTVLTAITYYDTNGTAIPAANLTVGTTYSVGGTVTIGGNPVTIGSIRVSDGTTTGYINRTGISIENDPNTATAPSDLTVYTGTTPDATIGPVQQALTSTSVIVGTNPVELDVDTAVLTLSTRDKEGKYNTQNVTSSDKSRYTVGHSIPLSTTLTIYDSLGNAHTVPITFEKTKIDSEDGNEWTARLATVGFTAPNGEVFPASNDIEGFLLEDDGTVTKLVMPAITLSFTTDGALKGTTTSSLKLEYNNGATDNRGTQTVMIDMNNLSQYTGSSTINGDADGNAMGVLKSLTADSQGIISGVYTNGITQYEAQVAVAQFNNAGGLTRTGANLYQVSANSGNPNINTAAALGCSITPASLELSNVDIANEFSDMIVTQRGFQSNSKMVTTGDEMLETLINMKR
jgi:flagellar hook protein FlgE